MKVLIIRYNTSLFRKYLFFSVYAILVNLLKLEKKVVELCAFLFLVVQPFSGRAQIIVEEKIDTSNAIACLEAIASKQAVGDTGLAPLISFYKRKFIGKHPNREAHWLYSTLHQRHISEFSKDSALYYLDKRLEISRELNDSFLLATDYQAEGSIHLLMEDYDKAINAFQKNLDILTALQDTQKFFYAYLNLGATYFNKNYYFTALTYFTEAKKQEQFLSPRVKARMDGVLLNNIGTIYSRIGRLEEANKTFQEVATDSTLQPYPRFLAYSNLFVSHLDLNNYPQAYQAYRKTLEYMQQYNFRSAQVYTFAVRLAMKFPQAGDPFLLLENAKAYCEKNEIQHSDELYMVEVDLLLERGLKDQAMKVLNQYLEIDSAAMTLTRSDALFRKADLLKKKQQYKKALFLFEKARSLELRLDSINRLEKINDLAADFEITRLESKLKEEQLENNLQKLGIEALRRKNVFRLIFFILVGVLLVSISIILWFAHQRSRATLIQKQQEEAILRLNQQNLEATQRKLQSKLLSRGLEWKRLKANLDYVFENQPKSGANKLLQAKIKGLFRSDENILQDFRSDFFALFPHFEQSVQEHAGNALSVRQMNYAILSALGLDISEIANTLYVSEGAVRKQRYMIKKKLNIQPEESLVIFLRQFLKTDESMDNGN